MNIKDALTKLGIESSTDHHHSRTGWVQIKQCPYCHSHNYHLGINVRGGYCNCYRCGRHPMVEVLSLLSNQKPKVIADLFKGLEAPIARVEQPRASVIKLPRGVGPMEKAHKDYLRQRGFDVVRLTELWDLQGINWEGGDLAWRIFIPIEVGGRLVNWTTRSIQSDAQRRYMTCPSDQAVIPRNEILYGIDYVRHCAILVEGPADVWAIGPGAVCPLGTSISQHHVGLLAQFPVRVICLDSQKPAQRVARGLVDQLSVFDGDTYNVILDSKDPGEATKKEIRAIRSHFGL